MFWRRLVAQLSAATSPALRMTVSPAVARPGGALTVRVDSRSVRRPDALIAEAWLVCDDQSTVPIRLWPGPAAGGFVGRASVPPRAGRCEARATVSGADAGRVEVPIAGQVSHDPPATAAALADMVARTGGVMATPETVASVAAAIRAARSTDRTPERRFPMRSWWWMLPLVASLGGEWWLRRHAGLR